MTSSLFPHSMTFWSVLIALLAATALVTSNWLAGKSLVCTVWLHTATNMPSLPQRLGIVFCLNRPCALYSVKVPFTCKNNTPSDSNPTAECLTKGMLSAASAKFSPGGDKLLFLSHDAAAASGVHFATAKLVCMPWSSGLSFLLYRPYMLLRAAAMLCFTKPVAVVCGQKSFLVGDQTA